MNFQGTATDWGFLGAAAIFATFSIRNLYQTFKRMTKDNVVAISINGQKFEGNNLSIVGGKVFIDDLDISGALGTNGARTFELKIEGPVGNVKVDNGTVVCGDVSGSVDAGSSVRCGNVDGSVDAGSSVQCGDVGKDVDAGSSVQCGKVSGSVNTGSNVSIRS